MDESREDEEERDTARQLKNKSIIDAKTRAFMNIICVMVSFVSWSHLCHDVIRVIVSYVSW